MSKNEHYSALENMYRGAPINLPLQPTIAITEGKSEIEIQVREEFFHAAGAVHGSIYFKMLDDAAFFAANSLERDVFVLTSSFTVEGCARLFEILTSFDRRPICRFRTANDLRPVCRKKVLELKIE